MADINSITLSGRLTKDLEIRKVGNDFSIGSVSIAVNRSVKKDGKYVKEAQFFDCTLLGKMADGLAPYMKKGQQVCLCGSLRQDRWEKDGKTNTKIYVEVEDVSLMGSSNGSNSGNTANSGQQGSAGNNAPAYNAGEEFPSDIPF